jgi:hypothetical protein
LACSVKVEVRTVVTFSIGIRSHVNSSDFTGSNVVKSNVVKSGVVRANVVRSNLRSDTDRINVDGQVLADQANAIAFF